MELREPKKKKCIRLQPQLPFPVTFLPDKWTIYTAHLTDFGSCIQNPDEITAIHSMGFFGKGSLSRSYPSFGKPLYGAPPIVRNRQWVQRQKWLEEVEELSKESLSETDKSISWEKLSLEEIINVDNNTKNISKQLEQKKSVEVENTSDCNRIEIGEPSSCSKHNMEENQPDIVEISEQIKDKDMGISKYTNIDEVILDSAEEDDICVIVSREMEKYKLQQTSEDANQDVLSDDKADEIFIFDSPNANEKGVYDNRDIDGKLLVLPDSDSETENYLKDIKPRIENEGFPIRETLHLTFEETFFLLFGLGCLQLVNFDGGLLDINNAWLYFCKEDEYFIQKYVVYHYFRSKGWVVKPGLKYGGDFLLYKQGPPFYHASYIVIIEVIDADTLIRYPSKCRQKLTWKNLCGLDRLSETAAKEILLAQVLWPSSILHNTSLPTPDVLSEFTVKELLLRRWIPKQNRDVVHIEDDDDEDSC